MRNKSKITTLESKFPLLSIEQGCMVSKDADITVAFRVELPELFTVTSIEYEAMHSAWHKAIKVLPNYSIVHKQDWFIKEDYQGKLSDGGLSFLARSSERHFNERPYLHHSVYLFLTKTNKQRMAQQSNFSSLCRGHLLPKEITNKDEVMKFMEAVDQFERIINDTEQIRIVRMTEDELVGTNEKGGLLDRYFSLSEEGHASLEDIRLGADLVRVGDNMLCLHTLSDTDDLPTTVSTDSRYERLSTDRSDCRLSFASPVGLMLPCNHIYNQYLFIEDSDVNLERFEKQARNMHSLARYSRSNQINEEWIQEYLSVPTSTYWHGVAIRKNFARSRMTWALHLLLWNATHATTPLMRQRSTGRAFPAMRQTFPQKSHSILSSSLPSASLRQRRTTRIRSLPSASRWQTAFQESPSTWIYRICR